jgi:hypothetical protein
MSEDDARRMRRDERRKNVPWARKRYDENPVIAYAHRASYYFADEWYSKWDERDLFGARQTAIAACPHRRLHQEILDLVSYLQPSREEFAMRLDLIDRLEWIIHSVWPQATVYCQAFFFVHAGLGLTSVAADRCFVCVCQIITAIVFSFDTGEGVWQFQHQAVYSEQVIIPCKQSSRLIFVRPRFEMQRHMPTMYDLVNTAVISTWWCLVIGSGRP